MRTLLSYRDGAFLSRPVVGTFVVLIGLVAGALGSAPFAAVGALALAEWLGVHLRHEYSPARSPLPATLGVVSATVAAAVGLAKAVAHDEQTHLIAVVTVTVAVTALATVAVLEARRFRGERDRDST